MIIITDSGIGSLPTQLQPIASSNQESSSIRPWFCDFGNKLNIHIFMSCVILAILLNLGYHMNVITYLYALTLVQV